MSLSAGTRLGCYDILAPLGAGGMGEVYRATDTKLKRQVAVKILPAALATDPDRLARFQREAEVLAALNHPHIAAIYGLEDAAGMQALVMELVEGPTLADRIAEGPIPIDEALPIVEQIAAALEAAHEQGIIHRDLKPANIKVRDDGTVKVLDFGLAKLSDAGASSRMGRDDPSQSPTLASPAAMTGVGIILGTAAYMSPEQARGRAVDKRTDVWAFGAVLYEILTGARAFEGEDVTETMAAVVKSTPDWTPLRARAPSHVVTLVQRCLEKDRNARIGDIAVARWFSPRLAFHRYGQRRASTAAAVAARRKSDFVHGDRRQRLGGGERRAAAARRWRTAHLDSGRRRCALCCDGPPRLHGRDLFYRSVTLERQEFFSAAIRSTSPFRVDTPHLMFAARAGEYDSTVPQRSWDVAADGKRFLLSKPANATDKPVTEMHVVLNWTEELKRLVP
jgi:hypothetical protein